MTSHSRHKTPEQMVEAIFSLDLDPIKFKLMDTKEGQGWTRDTVDRLELEYRRFLALIAKYPDDVIAPDTEVDKFWHGHILDTMKYAQDCEQVFGYFLHHFPYFGMRDEEDAASLADAAANTRRLYEQEFGVAASTGASYCARVADAAYCARATGEASVTGAKDAAYCARVAGQASAETGKDAAYCAAPTAGYCARVAGDASRDAAYCAAPAASYCARVAGEAGAGAVGSDAYCAATNASYLNTVLGKGRPTLECAPVQ